MKRKEGTRVTDNIKGLFESQREQVVANESGVPITTKIHESADASGTVRCCDYYQAGSGYQFSDCSGIGAIVR